ncbi:Dynein heavy chain [Phytophthora cinnamomi]|uniref:Dynein heavy chain n=1 Tax=Phytophthora cinnamomi TaxID=4785 RepID=UPI00355A5ACF|nr:Dynein heavy chain [Phytophthora cinnamomi]
MQVLVVQETMKHDEQNKRLSKTKKGADVSKLIPEGLDPYSRVYICTHGWKKRKSRGTGSRPRQHIRLTKCSFRFRVQWNLERMELQMKNGHFLHNHQVNTSTFATYPSSRGVVDTMVGARVEGMLAVGATRSKIYDYLLEHDQNVIQVDVDNLVREHASSVATEDDNDATAHEIAAFAAADPNNVSAVSETASGENWRDFVGDRPHEAYLRTFHYNYQLLTFMTMDEFGEGAVVQQSLLETNGDWHMERAVGHFKSLHPTQIDRLRVIVVYKDLNEIKVLQSNFPQVRVLICHFHVIKSLKEKRCKPEFCKICTDNASQIDAAIHAMVYADSEENYRIFHASFRGICARVGMQDFLTYFEKNWDASQERWVLYHRSTLPHFKNHTNNRLENFFGKLKHVVDGSMSMAGCVKALVAYDRRMQNKYGYRLARIGQFVNSNYDEEMSNVLRFTSHFVAEHIAGQYIGERADRKWYQAAEHGRKTAGEVTLEDLLDSLDREKPSLKDTQRRLSGVLVKYGDAESKKPKFKLMKNPVTVQDPFYILPEKLLAACMKLLPVGNTEDYAISVDPPLNAVIGGRKGPKSNQVETVVIKDVGSFTRDQIETFGRVQNLKKVVQLGMDTHKLRTVEGIPALPAGYHDIGNKVATDILESYPHKLIEGLPTDYPSCRLAGIQSAVPAKKKTRTSGSDPVDQAIRDRLFHVNAKRIFYYDPLNQSAYVNSAMAISTQLKIAGLRDYDVVAQNNPIQFDAYSCGVYVCWMFIRHVSRGPPLDMSGEAPPRRRFELFYYLLTGQLLPRQAVEKNVAEDEEKMTALVDPITSNADEKEDVPPTQVENVALFTKWVKSLGSKITDSVQARYWLWRKTSADDIFKRRKLDGGLDTLFSNPKLKTLSTYIALLNKKNPDKTVSLAGLISKSYGDLALARKIEYALNDPSQKRMAAMLAFQQRQNWNAAGKTSDEVFKMLQLDKAGYDLFQTPQLNSSFNYVVIANKNDANSVMLATLTARYSNDGLAAIFLAGAKP